MRRLLLNFSIVAILIFTFGLANAQTIGSMYISNLVGETSTDTLGVGQVIEWTINLNNIGSEQLSASNNGFRVFSPNGATWTPIELEQISGAYDSAFTPGNVFPYVSASNTGSGTGGDTVGMGGFDTRNPCVGFPDAYDAAVLTIRIPSPGIDSASAGKTICIDSAGYAVNFFWLWALCSGSSGEVRWGPLSGTYGGPVCYAVAGTASDVDESLTDILPASFDLEQNYPNPFNPSTNIWFDLPTRSKVTLKVYNLLGHEITTLVDEELPVGRHLTIWNGRDRTGTEVATGIYFYKMVAEDFVETRKMMLLR